MPSSTAPLPSVFALSPDERRAVYDAANERAMEAAHEATVASKLRNAPDPRADNYLTWKTQGMVCVLVVKHRDAPASFAVTRDGSGHPNVFLPVSRTQVLPESEGEFLLALIPRSYVNWLEGKEYAAGQRFRELFGITLPLSSARAWTDEQIETWKRLDNIRSSINYRIQTARSSPRKTYSKLPFGYTA